MNVLLINHTGSKGGAEISMLELVGGLPEEVTPTVACPDGPLAAAVRALEVPVQRIPEISATLRMHPVRTPLAVVEIGRAALQVARSARRLDAELIHANSIRAGIAATLASRMTGVPAVVHVRDSFPPGRVTDRVRRLIGQGARTIIANSRSTATAFASEKTSAEVRVIYSPVDLARFQPDGIDRAQARGRLGLDSADPALGVIGYIAELKGQETAVDALALVRERHPAAKLLVVGEPKFARRATRYDNSGYLERLQSRVRELGLGAAVEFTGEREDIPEILRSLDVVLVPSWEEGMGRIAAEAMAMGTPVAATRVGGLAEIIEDGRTGLLVAPRDARGLAEAVSRLLEDGELRRRLCEEGRKAAARFSLDRHVDSVVAAYRDAIGTGRQA
jgi:L-malate glycosyltransferase